MCKFAILWPDQQIVQDVLAQINWYQRNQVRQFQAGYVSLLTIEDIEQGIGKDVLDKK